jgi:protein-disulfide isomerase
MGSEAKAGALGLVGSLVPALSGLVASAMLLVDYMRPTPVFCAEGGGCAALRQTALAMPLGVPLPIFGVAGFVAIAVAALLRGERARQAQVALGGVAALVGLVLLVVQIRLGHLCVYCTVADTSGVLAAVAAAARLRFAATAPAPRVATLAGAGAIGAALLVPLVGGFRVPTTPQVIRDEMAKTPGGVATVVDFVDFECPFCRMTNADLQPLLAEHADRVRVVRRQVPLKIHPHAMDAARAACCAEHLGKGEPMANALFAAPEEELTPEGCEKLAAKLGVSLEPYRACVKDPATDALIAADKAEFQAAGGYALPTLWIGDEQIIGAQPPERLKQALDAALARNGS